MIEFNCSVSENLFHPITDAVSPCSFDAIFFEEIVVKISANNNELAAIDHVTHGVSWSDVAQSQTRVTVCQSLDLLLVDNS